MNYFISTSIPYVNSEPHIGFLWEILLADCFARFQRQIGNEVFFSTGADENGLNIAKIAEGEGIDIQKFVDKNTEKFFALKEKFNLTFDKFIRTTSEEHKKSVHKFWRLCEKDIYSDYYRGLYCLSCESYYNEAELENEKCPIHNKKPESIEEKNYFFKLTKYLPEIQRLIENNKIKVLSESRRHEILNNIKSGSIKDLSISRSRERMRGWGIETPDAPNQIVYVWFDALINYVSVFGFGSENEEKFNKFWNNGSIWHFVGKDISKFHAIYWPAMLLSAGLKIPDYIIVHEFILNDEQKMSKTLGNVVSPNDLMAKFDKDVIRYYFLKQNQFNDFNFSWSDMENVYSGELKNEIGNLAGRVFGILKKAPDKISLKNNLLEKEIKEVAGGYFIDFNKVDFSAGLEKVFSLVKRTNQFIEEKKLWQNGKEDDYATLILILMSLADFYAPVMPDKSKIIKDGITLENQEIFINKRIDFKPLF